MNAPALNFDRVEQGAVPSSLDIAILDGELSAEDSRDTVLALLLDLQKYHRRRILSHEERFGTPDPWSEKMLVELMRAFDEAREFVKHAKDSNLAVRLESSIKLDVSAKHFA